MKPKLKLKHRNQGCWLWSAIVNAILILSVVGPLHVMVSTATITDTVRADVGSSIGGGGSGGTSATATPQPTATVQPSPTTAPSPTSQPSPTAAPTDVPLPFVDSSALVSGSSDATKLLRFEVDGFTTGTTRVATWPNSSITVAGINIDNAWSGFNDFSSGTGVVLGGSSSTASSSDKGICFGTGCASSTNFSRIMWSTSDTVDTALLQTGSISNAWLIVERSDTGFDFAHAQQTNPTIFIHSANQSTTQWIGLTHDQTNGKISVGAGGLSLPAKLLPSGTAPTITSCGTSPSTVTGTDSAGRFTWGSGGTDSSCTVTFSSAWAVAPSCIVNDESDTAGALNITVATSTTAMEIQGIVAATIASDVVNYICMGGS